MSKKDFKLGADPEFGLTREDGYNVYASDFISDNGLVSEFGLDGGNTVAELRPKPSVNPFEVVANLRRAMKEGIKNNPDVAHIKWKAGSSVDSQPIGGHIHFGVKDIKHNQSEIAATLDKYLAQTTLLLEDQIEARDRRRGSYGNLGDCRVQPWGFEYRTPSSWITSPYIASGVLCLAKAIVWETLYNGLASNRAPTINRDHYMTADLAPIRVQFEQHLWPDIKKFELYKKCPQPIDLMHTLISKHKNWFPSCGMREAWAVDDIQLEGLKSTTLTNIWKEVRE